jgi:SHS2 domain-containing protein
VSEPATLTGGGSHRLLEHTADMGIEAQGESLADLFEQAALGLLEILGAEQVTSREERLVEVTGFDLEEVLVSWLSEILYLLEVHDFLAAALVIDSAGRQGLTARVRGETYDRARHQLQREVKAVTYHQLLVEEEDGRWRVRIFVDL